MNTLLTFNSEFSPEKWQRALGSRIVFQPPFLRGYVGYKFPGGMGIYTSNRVLPPLAATPSQQMRPYEGINHHDPCLTTMIP